MALNPVQKRKSQQLKPKVTYSVTIAGNYFSKNDHSQKPYEVTVQMSQEHIDENPLSVFKNHIAPAKMPQVYSDYGDLATHNIMRIVNNIDPDAAPESLGVMNRDQLLTYIDDNDYPIIEYLYKDVDALRQAVMDYEEDQEGFMHNQEIMHKKRGPAAQTEMSVLALNDKIERTDSQVNSAQPPLPQENAEAKEEKPAPSEEKPADKPDPKETKAKDKNKEKPSLDAI